MYIYIWICGVYFLIRGWWSPRILRGSSWASSLLSGSLLGNGGMDYGDYWWGLYRGYNGNPFPHSLLSTRQTTASPFGAAGPEARLRSPLPAVPTKVHPPIIGDF